MFRYLYGCSQFLLAMGCAVAQAQSNAPSFWRLLRRDKAVIHAAGVAQANFKFAAIPAGKFLTLTDVGCAFNQTTQYLRLHLALGSKYGLTDSARIHPLRLEGQTYLPNSPFSGSNFNVPANFKFGSALFPSLVIPLVEKGTVAGTCVIRGKLSTT